MTNPPTVYVVDDDAGMRNSISFALQKAEIPSQLFSSAKQVLETLTRARPSCLVVDFQMPEMSGLKLMQEVRELYGMVPFVLVTGYGSVPMAVEAMQLGAVTVIEKPFHLESFLDAVRSMLAIAVRQREQVRNQTLLDERLKMLTAREREIADLVVAGCLTKQIAKQLDISTKTVEVHRSHITKKLGVESVAQLVKMVMVSQFNAS